jgi:hypothetical protein
MKTQAIFERNLLDQIHLVSQIETAYKAILQGNCQKGMGAYIRILKTHYEFEKALLKAMISAKGGN